MSVSCFVDTNILVYAHDRSAGEKHHKAQELLSELWHDRTAAISTGAPGVVRQHPEEGGPAAVH